MQYHSEREAHLDLMSALGAAQVALDGYLPAVQPEGWSNLPIHTLKSLLETRRSSMERVAETTRCISERAAELLKAADKIERSIDSELHMKVEKAKTPEERLQDIVAETKRHMADAKRRFLDSFEQPPPDQYECKCECECEYLQFRGAPSYGWKRDPDLCDCLYSDECECWQVDSEGLIIHAIAQQTCLPKLLDPYAVVEKAASRMFVHSNGLYTRMGCPLWWHGLYTQMETLTSICQEWDADEEFIKFATVTWDEIVSKGWQMLYTRLMQATNSTCTSNDLPISELPSEEEFAPLDRYPDYFLSKCKELLHSACLPASWALKRRRCTARKSCGGKVPRRQLVSKADMEPPCKRQRAQII